MSKVKQKPWKESPDYLSHTFLNFSFLAAAQNLIIEVELHLGVHDESDDEDDVNDGEGDEGVVEGRLHLGPHQDQNRTKVAHNTHHAHHRHQHLKKISIRIRIAPMHLW